MGIKVRLTEAEFTRQVITFARLHGWSVAHFRAGRTKTGWRTAVSGDGKGFPDLICIHARRGVCIVAELKVKGGRLTAEQRVWIRAFEASGIPAYLWEPADWADIEAVLTEASGAALGVAKPREE